MKKEPTLKEQVKLLRARLNELDGDLLHEERKLEQRLVALEERLKGLPELYSRVRELEQVLGPIWTASSGHKVTPKMMSDNHLEAALAHVRGRRGLLGERLKGDAEYIAAFEDEIARRAADDHYHKLAGKIAPRVVIAKLTKWLRWLL